MPAGDGVSLPTTLAQMGSVAKTQAKGQQAATQTTPFADQLNRDDDLKVQRVKETEETKHQKIDPKQENADKRKRRRLKRNRKQLAADADDAADADLIADDEDPESAEQLGVLIDLRV
jgi:hypothetical protein